MEVIKTLEAVAAVATALGLGCAIYQLRVAARQAITEFEDTLASEYRALAASLPTEALLGGKLPEDKQQEALDEFYHYFDLSNGQIFLRQKGRVSKRTFFFWRDGMKAQLARPAFARAWSDISGRVPDDFKELRRLIAEDYKCDPRHWDGSWRTCCIRMLATKQMN